MSRIRLVATTGPRTNNAQALQALLKAGVDMARLNGSPGDLQWHAGCIAMLRELAPSIPILFDLPGRKIRIGRLSTDLLLAKIETRLAIDNLKGIFEVADAVMIDRLGEGPFEVCIEADVKDGEMLVGEIVLPGQTPDTIAWLADYCHPGQVNDSFSGLAMFAEVMRMLASRPSRRHTYKLLIFPETIGPAVYIAQDPSRLSALRGTVFSENIGWGEAWYLKATRRADTYMDLLAAECQRAFSGLRRAAFFDITDNDELIFDAVQAGVPSLSLQKFPFAGYHTSEDKPSRLQDADLQRAFDIIMHLVEVAEQDRVYRFVHPVPFHMSRYGLFTGYQNQREAFFRNREIVYNLLDGRRSLLAIAQQLQCPFADVAEYARRMAKQGLVREAGTSPWDQALDDDIARALRARP